MPSVLARYQRVQAAASATGGFVTTAELRDLGVPQSTVTRWCQSGHLVRTKRGVFRTLDAVYGFEELLHLAAKTMSTQQALGHATALSLWSLPGGSRGRVHLAGPKGWRILAPGVQMHESRDLRPGDITQRSGLTVTTALRSVLDTSYRSSYSTIGQQLTEAVGRELFSYRDIAQRVAELSRPGKPGLPKIRQILKARMPGAPVLSSYERSAKAIFKRAGYPPPIAQFEINVDQRRYFVDFAWPNRKLVVECDSMLAHSTPEQLQSDLDRQNALVNIGWLVLRFTYWDVIENPHKVTQRLAPHFPRSVWA